MEQVTMQHLTEVNIMTAVNWNIRRRDSAKLAGRKAEARHYQQNIDRLNAQLRQLDTVH